MDRTHRKKSPAEGQLEAAAAVLVQGCPPAAAAGGGFLEGALAVGESRLAGT